MTERILIVDDEPPILSSLARLLAFEPWCVVTAGSGDEALARLAEGDTAVILSDYHLGDMDGTRLLNLARERCPDTSRILFSGHIDIDLIRSAVNAGEVYRFVVKPWNDHELVQAVRHGIERWQLVRRNRLLNAQAEEQNRQLKRFNAELEAMVAERTADLELRNRALALSQEVLDGLPVAVIGLDPGCQLALANSMARRIFPRLQPGESALDGLPSPFWDWVQTQPQPGASLVLRSAYGPMRFEVMDLGGRGMVLTAIPLIPGHSADLPGEAADRLSAALPIPVPARAPGPGRLR
jgi:DNA-binding NarL/FixJ family response regulator